MAIALFLIGLRGRDAFGRALRATTCAALASSSLRDRHRADRWHRALRDVECFFHHREFQFDGVDGHHGQSFRDSLDQWTQKVLPADLYVRVGYVGQSSYLDESLAQSMGARRAWSTWVQPFRSRAAFGGSPSGVDALAARSMNRDHPDKTLWMMSTALTRSPAGLCQ